MTGVPWHTRLRIARYSQEIKFARIVKLMLNRIHLNLGFVIRAAESRSREREVKAHHEVD